MNDHFHDECAVFGIYGSKEASQFTYLGLYALQHRGQESTGIVSSDFKKMYSHLHMGLVSDAYKPKDLEKLPGSLAIGHNRYSTAGESHIKNAQPFLVDYHSGSLALAHNGNLTNADSLRKMLEQKGSLFRSSMDTEVIMHLIARSTFVNPEDKIIDALKQVRGAYSLLAMTPDTLIAVRDPFGIRPLSIGILKDGSYCVASETCSFNLIGARFMRDVEPGEMVMINQDGISFHRPFSPEVSHFCIFEMIYFARPDSMFYGRSVHNIRKGFGRALWEEAPVEADLVMAVPDSGISVAMGLAEASGIPYELGLTRNHYVGRTFIEPKQSIRDFGVKIKLNPIEDVIKGKRVIVVDDSIVRGTTSKKIIKLIREAGAKEVHMRISSPPTKHPCFYGIDTPKEDKLIAHNMSVEEIGSFIEADSLAYISTRKLLASVHELCPTYCKACFDGHYPVSKEQPLVSELF